ncbi:hypothetical protein PENTCL1PPCAC_13285 [Pristionchus entomophagus]|uniref:F-box domain-containing protein n=1 Tax=Pristionchus entomophagus TaxID=358040 RepID=A0AAV5TEJ8_9BILA|nr:hypothetical protein PENTCL1PPCAC_13285 [Pristionchus entomophagus]
MSISSLSEKVMNVMNFSNDRKQHASSTTCLLSLPDVFLHELMKTVEIKDRLRLRLTSRAFEKLVADSKTGYFEHGRLFDYFENRSNKRKLALDIGDGHFTGIESTEEGFEQFLNDFNRICCGISLGTFEVHLDDISSPNLVRKLTHKFNIDRLMIRVGALSTLERARQLFPEYPRCKHELVVTFLPNSETLLILRKMGEIHFDLLSYAITTEELIDFLSFSSIVQVRYLESVTLNKLKTVIEIISADTRPREASFCVKCMSAESLLADFGFARAPNTGDVNGECEVINCTKWSDGYIGLELRFKNCHIHIRGFIWSEGDWIASIAIANHYPTLVTR